jgi:hypothetical protein
MCRFVVVTIGAIRSPTAVGAFNDFCTGCFSLPDPIGWLGRGDSPQKKTLMSLHDELAFLARLPAGAEVRECACRKQRAP